MKFLKLRYCLLFVLLVALVAMAWQSTTRRPVDRPQSTSKSFMADSSRTRGSGVLSSAPPSSRADAPPGGRLTSVKVTISGTREDYVTDSTLRDVGMFYLDFLPRRARLVRAITGGRLLWFAEFEEPTGTKIFITVRTSANDADAGAGTDKTKVSIVRIPEKVK